MLEDLASQWFTLGGGAERALSKNGNSYVLLWVNYPTSRYASRHLIRKHSGDIITEAEADTLYLELVGDSKPSPAYLYHKKIAARESYREQ